MEARLTQSPEVRLESGRAVELAPQDAALLAWLALEGPTPRQRLVALMWPDSAPQAGRNSLRQRLFKLKRQCGADLVSGTHILALDAAVAHDLDTSHALLGKDPHDHSVEFGTWLRDQRDRRRTRWRQALIERADRAERDRAYADALPIAIDILRLEPLSEDAHRRLIRLHYLAGDRAAALLAFDQCEELLKHEVGTRPSAQTMALLATVESMDDPEANGPAAVPASVLRPPRMVGRGPQGAALERALLAHRTVLLRGEAGMGKSRLLDEVLRRPEMQGHTLAVAARPGDAQVPHAVAARWLRALLAHPGVRPDEGQRAELAAVLPELGAPPSGAGDPSGKVRLVGVVEALLRQAVAAGLQGVAVDDLHFADAASIELWQPLMGLTTGCAWVLALRPAEGGEAAKALVEAQGQASDTVVIDLPPLDAEGVLTLLASLELGELGGRGPAAALLSLTGGNPLYLLETLKATLEGRSQAVVPAAGPQRVAPAWPVADSVVRLIQQRLARLSPAALKLMRCAAVAGQDLSSALVAHVLGTHPLDMADAWAELEAAQVLRDGAFAHDLIAEAALASVPKPIARHLHAQVAAWLETQPGHPARTAAHWLAAGVGPKAVPHLLAAAALAKRAWQSGEAARLYEQAGHILQGADDTRGAFEALLRAADNWSSLRVDDHLIGLSHRLEALARTDGERASLACLQIAILAHQRRLDDALQLAHAALPLARSADMADVEVELLWGLLVLNWDRRSLAEAAAFGEQALARLPDVNHDRALVDVTGMRFKLTHALGLIAVTIGQYAKGDDLVEAAWRLSSKASQGSSPVSGIAVTLAQSGVDQGDARKTRVWAAQALTDDDRDFIDVSSRANTLAHLARCQALFGEIGLALELGERAVALCDDIAVRYDALVRSRHAWLLFELGRRDLALKTLQPMVGRGVLPAMDRTHVEALRVLCGEPLDAQAVLTDLLSIDDYQARVRLLCLLQPALPPQTVEPLLALHAMQARDFGAHGLWLALQARRVAACCVAGRIDEAADLAQGVWAGLESGRMPAELYPRVAASLVLALREQQPERAQLIAFEAMSWMHRAAATLPVDWRDNFLSRTPLLQSLVLRPQGLARD